MDLSGVTQMAARTVYMAAVLTVPLLLICLAVGIVISIFQATTQIHEQSLSFVPKVAVVVLFLAVAGPWMVRQLLSFTREAFAKIAGM